MGIYKKKEFDLKDKAKVVVEERLYATKKKIELFSYMDLPKMKNRIYQKKNSRFSKNCPKFYWIFQRQK